MKKPENFTAGATRKNLLEEAINNNFNSPVVKVEPVAEEKPPVEEEPKRNVREKFIVSMSMGERGIYKSFCALRNVSMNHFVICAMDYFKEELEKGRVDITPHGYKRK